MTDNEKQKTLQILKHTRVLLTPCRNWTQSASARNRHGKPVKPTSASACQWCLSGAVTAVLDDLYAGWFDELHALSVLAKAGIELAKAGTIPVNSNVYGGNNLTRVQYTNDHSIIMHKHVLLVLDRATGNVEQSLEKKTS